MFALAFLALVLKVLAPPGFMVGAQPGGHGVPIVICTAQGQLVLDDSKDHAPAQKPGADAPCVFAGNGLGAGPPASVTVASVALADYQPLAAKAVADLSPGQALAAPPPPSRGPPRLL